MHEGGSPEHPHRAARPPSDADTHDLAIALAPALAEHCNGRLGPIEWFRATWQRGGAATGFSTWTLDNGHRIGVIVKFPVGPCELRWTTALGAAPLEDWHTPDSHCLPTPRLVASGLELGGYDLAWLITERLQGPALSSGLTEQSITDLLTACADFQSAALQASPVSGEPPAAQWDKALEHARQVARAGGIHDDQKWNDTIKKVQKHLAQLQARWDARPINAWCHGDLHPGNALRRPVGGDTPTTPTTPKAPTTNGTGRGCVLIDLALVHPGHWIEDALYLERQFWGHEPLLHGIKPLTTLAKLRRDRGLPANDHYPELANIRRVLTGACAPALVEREGNPKYLHAALEVVERLLPQVIK
jgi:hypothetical protein